MKNDSTHPARSAEFLSRLHDGELTAGQRAHFESHRAHCADCRGLASEFEAALSLFRASTTSPPPPDLPARILRGLSSTTRRRPPFGVVFGINLKWAAAFSTALIAVIIGSAVVFQRDAALKIAASQTPIPVILPPKAAARQAQAPAPSEEAARQDRPPPARALEKEALKEAPSAPASAPADSVAGSAAERFGASPTPQSAAAPEQKARALSRRAAQARIEEPDRSASNEDGATAGFLRKSESAGGEGAATSSAASAEPGPPARLILVSLDGEGNAPEVVSAGAAERLSDLRGHQYFLIVEASGRVREARTESRKERFQKRNMARDAAEIAAAPASVWSLRFRAGDRPRRLLLRVE
jgi:hypothetical protein